MIQPQWDSADSDTVNESENIYIQHESTMNDHTFTCSAMYTAVVSGSLMIRQTGQPT